MSKVGFIGLGVMGFPMAGWLSKAGHNVTVFNRSTEKTKRWCKEFQGQAVSSLKELAVDAEVVFVCVGDDPDVREVLLSPRGVLSEMNSGSVLVDHTTASAEIAREVAEAVVTRGISCLD
ncbi:uncharacterized protein METZ01_LOCUS114568, partial [marine metagenome]